MSAPQVPVWTWRDAVRQADVPSLTKLICYSIANYLADVGAGCFPSVQTLIKDAGMSNRSVATHLQNAVDAGLLVIERRTGRDGRRQLTHYLPRFPDNATLVRRPAAMRDPHAEDEAAFDVESHVSELHVGADDADDHVSLAHADRPREGASRGPREPDDASHVNLVQQELSTRELSIPPKSPTAARRGTSSGKFVDEAGKGCERSDRPSPCEDVNRQRQEDERSDRQSDREGVNRQRQHEPDLQRQLTILRTEGRHRDAVEGLVAPLVASGKRLSVGRGAEARAALAEIAAKAHGLPGPALAAAVKRIVERPSKATVAAILAEIETARKFGEARYVRPGQPEWAAWLRHFQTTEPQTARAMEKSGLWTVRTQWPPHPASREVTP